MGTGLRRATDDEDALDEQHDINVTPFIDVMLVLLIIFMVAAPLATVDIPVELPAASAAASAPDPDPVILTVQADLSLRLGQAPVSRQGLKEPLQRVTGGDTGTRIFLRADRGVAYGDLMDTMNALRDAGYTRVALVALERTGE